MVSSLEEYVAKATSAFQPSTTAIQNQIEGLAGKLDATNEAINKNYAQQQARLDLNRNQAAETASMQAAGSGGSFGGAANLANRKYYDQTFVPAVTQMRTNQANELSAARQANDDTRNNLNSQLSSLLSQANQQGLSQYYSDTNADLARQFEAAEAEKQRQYAIAEAEKERQYQIAEAEKQRQFQAEQAALDREASRRAAAASAASNSRNYYNNASNSQYALMGSQNLYGGYDWVDLNGNPHRVATVAEADGGDFNNALWRRLQEAGDLGDRYSQLVWEEMGQGARFEKNRGGSTGNAMYDTLGIRRIN